MKIVTAEQMRNIDQRASQQYVIPSIVLMENAALAVVRVLGERFSEAERVAIFCGPGQNGGDGLAAARHLESRGVTPELFLIGSKAKYKGDARTNLAICERLGLPLHEVLDTDSLDQALALASQSDLVVDATLANRYWKGADALGKRIRTGGDTTWYTIIGEIGRASCRERV